MISIAYWSDDCQMIEKRSAAEMLETARRLYETELNAPDYPGRERILSDTRRRIALLEKRAMEERKNEAEQDQEGHTGQ